MNAINEIVDVNAFYFPGGSTSRVLPRAIEFGNTRRTFTDGLQYLIRKGDSVIKLFDMSDGQCTYRLRLESNRWTLVSVKPAA